MICFKTLCKEHSEYKHEKHSKSNSGKTQTGMTMARVHDEWDWQQERHKHCAWKKKRKKATIYCESCVCLMSLYSSRLASLVAWIILASPYLLYPSADNYPLQENGTCFGIKQAELEIFPVFPVTLGLLIYLLCLGCFYLGKIVILPYTNKIVIINDACLVGP